jgi:hypothetical protein
MYNNLEAQKLWFRLFIAFFRGDRDQQRSDSLHFPVWLIVKTYLAMSISQSKSTNQKKLPRGAFLTATPRHSTFTLNLVREISIFQ